jgi:hypothetical protein
MRFRDFARPLDNESFCGMKCRIVGRAGRNFCQPDRGNLSIRLP